jgi:hypothetical protein
VNESALIAWTSLYIAVGIMAILCALLASIVTACDWRSGNWKPSITTKFDKLLSQRRTGDSAHCALLRLVDRIFSLLGFLMGGQTSPAVPSERGCPGALLRLRGARCYLAGQSALLWTRKRGSRERVESRYTAPLAQVPHYMRPTPIPICRTDRVAYGDSAHRPQGFAADPTDRQRPDRRPCPASIASVPSLRHGFAHTDGSGFPGPPGHRTV